MPTILVVDDNPDIRATLELQLGMLGYDLLFAVNGKEGLTEARRSMPDLILLDISMPVMDGVTACKEIKKDPLLAPISVIMLTAHNDREAELLTIGADDFINKPFDLEKLQARIVAGLRITASRQESFVDALTKLYNRGMFDIVFAQWQANAVRYKHPLSMIMVDIDFFKKVNDTHGHDVGDLVLQSLSGIIRREIRTSDLAARYGGEEFILLLPETDIEGALKFAEKLRVAVESENFPTVGRLTASFGVAAFTSEKENLMKQADIALYRAKESGRNCVRSSGK